MFILIKKILWVINIFLLLSIMPLLSMFDGIVCTLKICPDDAKIGFLQGESGELALFTSFIDQLMQDYSDQEKNIYCGFNSRFVITKEDRNQAIGKEFLKMETRYRKKELNLVVAHNTLQQLIGGAFFKIENNGSEIFIESFFIRNISDKEAFKLLYKNMIIAMGA